MGVMAEIDMEREEDLQNTGWEYLEALELYKGYINAYPPAHRTSVQAVEVSRLEELLALAKYKYDAAKENRHRL